MKRFIIYIFMVTAQCMALTALAQQPAFPGAEGYGRYTTGGRGGSVCHVTSLADDGSEGTFRWACNQSGARTIVFDVSGTIFLTSELRLRNGDVTIAGQTAPGDGICIADYPFFIGADNVIIRYIRFRLGNRHVDEHEGDGLGSMDHHNIVIDHCSVSWSIDECLSVYGGKNLTVQWCIAAQSLRNSGHSKGAHGYGGNWGGSGASYHHNLIAHHQSRTPRLGPRPGTQLDERMDMRNNVIYNWAGEGCYGGEAMNVNIVNNYYQPGPATVTRNTTIQQRIAKIGCRTSDYTNHGTAEVNEWDKTWHVWGDFYVDGNINSQYEEVARNNWRYGIYNQASDEDYDGTFTQKTRDTMKVSKPTPFVYTTTHTAQVAYEKVLNYAGASKRRDWQDEQIVDDVTNGTYAYGENGIIDSQDDTKGDHDSAWPELSYTATEQEVIKDTDGDGMPDLWEMLNGLNAEDASDGAIVTDDGYSNLEHYLNSLVEDITSAQNDDGVVMEGQDRSKNSGEQEKAFVLNQQSFVSESHPTEHESVWTFQNGFAINVDDHLVCAAGYFPGVSGGKKYSPNMTFTIQAPDGIELTGIKVTGGSNSATVNTYVKQLGETTYGEKDYQFPAKDGSTAKSYDFGLSTPQQSVAVVFGGEQGIYTFELYYTGTATGIRDITTIGLDTAGPVYDLNGRRIVDASHKGIYIIKGKKLIK